MSAERAEHRDLPGWLRALGMAGAGLWIVAVTGGVQALGWLAEQYTLLTEEPLPTWVWPVLAAAGGLLALAAALLVRVLARRPAARAAGTAWAFAALLSMALVPLRVFPLTQPGLGFAATAAVCWAVVLGAWWHRRAGRPTTSPSPAPAGESPDPLSRGTGRTPGTGGTHGAPTGDPAPPPASAAAGQPIDPALTATSGPRRAGAPVDEPAADPGLAPRYASHRAVAAPTPQAVPLAAAAGLLMLLPWAWAGSFGGPVLTLLALLSATGLGALAGTVLSGQFWVAFGAGPGWRRVLGGGAAVGITLLPLCAGIGQGGAQLALLGSLPLLGFPIAALYRRGTAGRVVGVAVGVAAAGPLAFVAPVQLSVVLGTREVGWYALLATLGAAFVGLALALGYAVALRRVDLPRWPAVGVTVLALVAGVSVYAVVGHPGFHADRLFVVLRGQADLSGLPPVTDRPQRAEAVYRRLVDTAQRSQRSLRRALTERGIGYTPYYLVDAVEVDGNGPALRDWLARRSDVDRVLLSPRLRPLPARPAPLRGTGPAPQDPQWNIAAIGADRVVSELGVSGRGIVVGSSDSGVDGTHPALRRGFRGGADSWYDPWYGSRLPTDYGGHGTHTLGSAVGRGPVPSGMVARPTVTIGVAPGAHWVGCVNLARNLGNPAWYLDCWQFMLAPFPYGGNAFTDGDPARAPQVLTNSWGCSRIEGCDADALAPAAGALTAAGIFVVAAAGNSGPRCGSVVDPPARYTDVLSVGALDSAGQVAGFSSRGSRKPDLSAPGTGIVSALPGGYGTLSGTSMAAPQVAGVVALMWSANPRLIGDIATTRRILLTTATPQPGDGPSCGGRDPAGAGRIDAYAAVRAAQRLPGTGTPVPR